VAGPSSTTEFRVAVPTLRVACVYAAADTSVARALTNALRDAGIELLAPNSEVHLDGLVAIISMKAVADAHWREQTQMIEAGRIIPVRVGQLDAVQVPDRLSELNWIDWSAENPARVFGSVLAGLLADPGRHQLSRQLLHEAQAWDHAGRPRELLLGDHRRAEQMNDLLGELKSDPLASPSPLTVEFVQRSATITGRAHRRRRRWRIFAAVIGISAVSAVIGYLPEIQARSKINHAAIVTTGEQAVLDELPEWSAANAAELLMEGTSAQQALGRFTLLAALQQPWGISNVDYIENVRAMATVEAGRRAVVLAAVRGGSALAEIDIRQARIIWSLPLSGTYEHLAVSPDGHVAVVAGVSARAVDLETGATLPLTTTGPFRGARIAADGTFVLWTLDGHIDRVDPAGVEQSTFGQYAAVLDVQVAPGGALTALVLAKPGVPEIVDLQDSRVIAKAQVPGALTVGSLSPDGRAGILPGGDGQLWGFGARRALVPTGIAVPAALDDIRWVTGERIVLVSDSERGQVYYLPRAELLGHVCWDVQRPLTVGFDPESGVLSCVGAGLRSFWSLPPTPRSSPVPGESSATAVESPDLRMETSGVNARIFWRGALGTGSTASFEPTEGIITAVSLSPSGRELIIGSQSGQATVIALSRQDARIVIEWHTPDYSPVTAVGWDAGGPVASTASGQTWSVPNCAGCTSDAGLLDAARARFEGCLTERQMQWIDDSVRARLGLILCPPAADLPVR
jgi:hypothetical protein